MEYLQYTGYKFCSFVSRTDVLNLVINGIPSIQKKYQVYLTKLIKVLNLVINGIPSIRKDKDKLIKKLKAGFKPCYKWNTFNTRL